MSRFVVLLLALVAGVGAAIWYYRSPEAGSAAIRVARPSVRFLDDLTSQNPRDVERGTAEVQQLGTSALPAIRATLQDDGAPQERRRAALKACAILGPSAAEAIPDIIALLQDPEYAPEAALAASFMGSLTVVPLEQAFHNSDDGVVRREALRSIGKLRERASIDPQLVLPLLFEGLADPDPSVREIAVTYLGIVRDDPTHAVPALAKALDDEDAGVRRAAAVALGAYGALAQGAVPALRKAMRDPDEDVRREAGRALVLISEGTKGG
ncbi:MAG TPA: HEAT repeat domain-containing protein [Vicinamibacterales bacterium]|nr:HEAT repeat domain-containing protein [Vicinamibacterales bacterium]